MLNFWRPNVFERKIDVIIEAFSDNVQTKLLRSLTELLELTESGQLLSVSRHSFDLKASSDGNVRIDSAGFDNCSCLLQPKTCSTQAAFYTYQASNKTFTPLLFVTGIRVGCFPLQSILLSTLECWYSTDCYEMVRLIYN